MRSMLEGNNLLFLSTGDVMVEHSGFKFNREGTSYRSDHIEGQSSRAVHCKPEMLKLRNGYLAEYN